MALGKLGSFGLGILGGLSSERSPFTEPQPPIAHDESIITEDSSGFITTENDLVLNTD
jgi:hypothetical protein